MGLPTITKTWQYNINQRIAGASTQAKDVLLAIVNSLLGFGSNPWTVRYSSASTGPTTGTAGDGVNYWTNAAALVYAAANGSAHSWIVLKQTNIASNLQILIDLSGSTTTSNANIYVSANAGFTGGSSTNRPTATDEQEITPQAAWGPAGSTTKSKLVHAVQSTDGECTRVFVCGHDTNNRAVVGSVWILDKINSPRAEITYPYACCVYGADSDVTTTAIFNNAARIATRLSVNSLCYITAEGVYSRALLDNQRFPDDISGAYPLSPMGLFSKTASATGRYGLLYDMWWGPRMDTGVGSVEAAPGDIYDETTNTLIAMGQFIVPSNGVYWKVS
jgi:hypothetical protein